jgi:dienelactone hydrolase
MIQVYLPDFFNGDPVGLKVADALLPVDATAQSTFSKYTGLLASMPTFLMWRSRHKHADVDKTCMDFLASLRRATPDKKIGMVGFCWGGRYAIRAGMSSNCISINGTTKPLIDAVVALHPSNLVLPDDITDLVVPVSYGWGVEDVGVSYATRGKIETYHEEKKKKGKKVPEMQHVKYEPGRHGFAVRGNPEDERERKCLEESERQALEWMGKWL